MKPFRQPQRRKEDVVNHYYMEMSSRYGTTFHMERMPEIMKKHGVELR